MQRALDVELIRTRGLPSAERRAVERSAMRGLLQRVRPGVLVRAGALDGLWPEERHLVVLRANAPFIDERAVVSHESACALLGIPVIGDWPVRVHLADATTGTTRVSAHFVRHGVRRRPIATVLDALGLRTSDGARTAVDIAARRSAVIALPVVDHVLRVGLATPQALGREVGRLEIGATKAQSVVEMGSALSGSPAESLCRVRFRQLGTPEPIQQHEFRRPGEPAAIVDFWFPDQGVVVEVDGRGKYEDPAMLDGRSTAEAHWREKRREDFVRSFPEVRFVLRLSWQDLAHPERVRAALRRAGVPCR
ncbi:hypothetical protein ACRQ4C_08480 [Curtobacterium sp. SP.BCp]|uniref:hypothetical protein n=1 Tax=Curtobacterium sp. SP.BCp TaxID=3435230 RepID=UPI003F734D66